MNENLNLVEILKDCPKGTKLYYTVYGEVEFDHIANSSKYPIVFKLKGREWYESLTSEGKSDIEHDGECILFPSKDQRDWSKFKPKKNRFDPKTLQPFDKVLARTTENSTWRGTLLSYYNKDDRVSYPCVTVGYVFSVCIPYNDETKHLLGTSDEAPEYYRYWED